MGYRYMILDSRSTVVARAMLESPPDAPTWYLRVMDGAAEGVMEHEYLQLVSMDESAPAKKGRVQRRREDVIVVETLDNLDDETCQNLRVQVKFTTYLFPITGHWRGRLPAISHDLSCGGVAFYCASPLAEGEQIEVIVPITSEPLVLKAEILRLRPSNSQIQLYSAKFIDMVREEEALVREAVFGQQIKNRPTGQKEN